MRKPFDVLGEGLVSDNSRGEKSPTPSRQICCGHIERPLPYRDGNSFARYLPVCDAVHGGKW